MPLNWLHQLRHTLSHLPGAGQATRYRPLIDSQTLQEIRQHTADANTNLLRFDRPVAQMRIGDRLSRFRGQGFEFEENRRYQPGDEQRLINWRLYARRGELFSKVYIEERRPEVYILLDRRASMRFATRRQLKVSLAAKIAIAALWQAQQQVISAGGVVLNDQAQWFMPNQGQSALAALIAAINAPCPPQPFASEQIPLQDALTQIDLRLSEGSFLLLLSDFIDFDPKLAAPVLQRLGERHTVQAIQINDMTETRLPEHQSLWIDDPTSDQPFVLDPRDATVKQAYHSTVEQQQDELRNCLIQSNIALTRCHTNLDWQDCLQQAVQGIGIIERSHG